MAMQTFVSTPQARWLYPAAATLIAIAALVSTLWIHRQCASALRQESVAQKSARDSLDQETRARPPACAREFDYARSLPASISLDRLSQSLQDSSKAFGVTVLSISGEPHAATEKTLGNLVVSMSLHGAYPAIKSTLGESLARFPTATLQRLQIRRAGATQPVLEDASVEIAFALRPAMPESVACSSVSDNGAARESR